VPARIFISSRCIIDIVAQAFGAGAHIGTAPDNLRERDALLARSCGHILSLSPCQLSCGKPAAAAGQANGHPIDSTSARNFHGDRFFSLAPIPSLSATLLSESLVVAQSLGGPSSQLTSNRTRTVMAIGLVGGVDVVTATRGFSSSAVLARFAIAPVSTTEEVHHHQPAAPWPHAPALRSSTWPAAAALPPAVPRLHGNLMSCYRKQSRNLLCFVSFAYMHEHTTNELSSWPL
jgi:hypothetical protein